MTTRLIQTQNGTLPYRKRKKCRIYLCEWVFFRLIAIEERESDKRRMLSESDFVRVQNGADWRGSTAFPKCIINFVFSKLNFMKRIGIIFFFYLVFYDEKKLNHLFRARLRLLWDAHISAFTFHSTLLISISLHRTKSLCVDFALIDSGVVDRKMFDSFHVF